MGVPQDLGQAAIWYRKAADEGNADAQTALERISPSDNEEKQLIVDAMQCSESALRRYALSSADPAEKVTQAAFDKCIDLWRRYGESVGRRIDASAETIETQKNCKKFYRNNCPVKLPASLDVINAAEEFFVHDATIEVFDIRAAAAGK